MQHKAKWYRGILPGGLMGAPVGWQSDDVCTPTIIGDFDSILEDTGVAATDGAGGAETDARTRMVAAGAFVMCEKKQQDRSYLLKGARKANGAKV